MQHCIFLQGRQAKDRVFLQCIKHVSFRVAAVCFDLGASSDMHGPLEGVQAQRRVETSRTGV